MRSAALLRCKSVALQLLLSLKDVRGVFYGVPGLTDDYVEMISGRGSGGSRRKFEMVVMKG